MMVQGFISGGGKYGPQFSICDSPCSLQSSHGQKVVPLGILLLGIRDQLHGHRRSDEDCGGIKIHLFILMLHNQRVNDVMIHHLPCC